MYNELKSEKVLSDLERLFKNTENYENENTMYTILMKERFLNLSTLN